jgi:hypothetical protein
MSEANPDRIDRLVRQHLERQEARFDGAEILWMVKRRQAALARRATVRRYVYAGAGGLASAAALILVLLWGGNTNVAQAGPEQLVREAKDALAVPADRCYQMSTAWPPELVKQFPVLGAATRESKLWTRGDRFWIDTTAGERHWSWGRTEDGAVWFVHNKTAVLFEADEIGGSDVISAIATLYSMQPEHLLELVLNEFDLAYADAPDAPGLRRVVATGKPGREHRNVLRAVVDINPATKVIQRIVLERLFRGEAAGEITFTLADSQPQPDEDYTLAGHTDPGVRVLDRDHAPARQKAVQLLNSLHR